MEKKRLIIVLFIILLFIIGIVLSFFYYQGKYTVSFETGTNEDILTQYIKKNETIEEPNTPIKEGYVFIEWQLDGETFDFDTKIDENTILTAKWMREDYITVSYISNCEEKIEVEKLLKGSIIENLPTVSKDGYIFIGWYNNDKLYTNEEINDDITLEAKFEKIEDKLNVGDKVYIKGSYSESAYSNDSYHSAAIGWNRYILNIIEGSNYPYVVGNKNGVTGFFNKESLDLIK